MQQARRISELPPYLFAELDRKKEAVRKRGVDIIDFGVGDPDLPTPGFIVDSMCGHVNDPGTHHYPSYQGRLDFREAAAEWYSKTFGVELDPASEVITLIGSKEGIAHLPLGVLDPGDIALCPDPAYPVYVAAMRFAGGKPYLLPLSEKNGFLPDFEAVPGEIAGRSKLMFLNYPNNPTAACADASFFKQAVDFAGENDLLISHDNPYSELAYDGYRAPSILEVPGAKDHCIEFHSLSKTFNMTGWRIGFAVGNRDAVAALVKVKTNIDSGAFEAVQLAAITALRSDMSSVREACRIYEKRRDLLLKGLRSLGLDAQKPKATFYIWAGLPEGESSLEYSTRLLEETGIMAAPGIRFGDAGEGYVRFAFTRGDDVIAEAVKRMEAM